MNAAAVSSSTVALVVTMVAFLATVGCMLGLIFAIPGFVNGPTPNKALVAMWIWTRVKSPTLWDYVLIPFAAATVMRYVLRKEMLQDVRGLRKDPRHDELT